MTEIPSAPVPPLPPAPVVTTRLRRRLVIIIAAGVVVAAAVFVAIHLMLGAPTAKPVALYVSNAEHYSVKAPGEKTQQHIVIVQPLGIPATTTRWTDDKLYYSVSSAKGDDLPPTPVWRAEFLHDVLVAALGHAPGVSASSLSTSVVTNAFLTKPDEITLSGSPAYAFKLTVPGAPAPFHVVFAGHGSTLYLLVNSYSADSRDEDFLDSFSYLD
ncbi:MAG TPA: hypothetical protein VGM38_05290 [Pseudolysinimonas sp.]